MGTVRFNRITSASAVRAESYSKVVRVGLRTKKRAFDFQGSGFFTEENPNFLITAAHVKMHLVRLGLVEEQGFLPVGQARLCGMNQEPREAVDVQFRGGRIIYLPESHIDVAGLWVTTADSPLIMNVGPPSLFRGIALSINPAEINVRANYFVPVIKSGRFYEFCGRVLQGERTNEYVLNAQTWPGYSGSPVFDEDGLPVGVIHSGVGVAFELGHKLTSTRFTPFSVLNKFGLFDSFVKY